MFPFLFIYNFFFKGSSEVTEKLTEGKMGTLFKGKGDEEGANSASIRAPYRRRAFHAHDEMTSWPVVCRRTDNKILTVNIIISSVGRFQILLA